MSADSVGWLSYCLLCHAQRDVEYGHIWCCHWLVGTRALMAELWHRGMESSLVWRVGPSEVRLGWARHGPVVPNPQGQGREKRSLSRLSTP